MKTAPSIDFVGRSRAWVILSATLLLISVLALLIRGLNLSIDFVGGTSFTLSGVETSVTADDLQGAAEAAGGADVRAQIVTRGGDEGNGALVRMAAIDPDSEIADDVTNALLDTAGTEQFDVAFVGPTWGRHISSKAIEALVVFLVVVVLYISIRLEFKMAIGAVIALVHDIVITIGVYALLGFNVSPNTVIALLTILGYSLYDTVVVFDRVEENFAFIGGPGLRTYRQVMNTSMNEVLWRSLNTSLTSLLPVGALLFLGSQLLGASTLEDLALALFVGMGLGAYSSLFVAGPFVAWSKAREPEMVKLAEKFADVVAVEGEVGRAGAIVEERKPITTEYVRGEGRRKRRGR